MTLSLIMLAAVVVVALGVLAWIIARVELRVWLIPRKQIAAEGQRLIRTHGRANAHWLAAQRSLDAWNRSDAYEAARWGRVASWLKTNAGTGSRGHAAD